MSPRHATKTSFKPKEGKRFSRRMKISLHDGEHAQIEREAERVGLTPAEWVRDVVRDRLFDATTREFQENA